MDIIMIQIPNNIPSLLPSEMAGAVHFRGFPHLDLESLKGRYSIFKPRWSGRGVLEVCKESKPQGCRGWGGLLLLPRQEESKAEYYLNAPPLERWAQQ